MPQQKEPSGKTFSNFPSHPHSNGTYIYSELEQLQNEKRKALLEHETAKLRECDDALQRDLRDWKGQLLPRKQVYSLTGISFFKLSKYLYVKTQSKKNLTH